MLLMLLLLLLLGAWVHVVDAQTCTNGQLSSTTSPQSISMSTMFKYDRSSGCFLGTRTALYASFTPPSTNNYYVRAYTSSTYLRMEILLGSACDGAAYNCNDALISDAEKVGFESISLAAGNTYVFLIAYYSLTTMPTGVTLELGLASAGSGATCTNNLLMSYAEPQTKSISTTYQHSTNLGCMSSGSDVMAQYATFIPSVTGYYNIRAPYNGAELVVEVRSDSCGGFPVECQGGVLGIQSLRLFSGEINVILVARKDGGTLSQSSLGYIEVGMITAEPTRMPTWAPTTVAPTRLPTRLPTTLAPTTLAPTLPPTRLPTTLAPTLPPTRMPTTLAPTRLPTLSPTRAPTVSPTRSPTLGPTHMPSTRAPTSSPTQAPTLAPTTLAPSTLTPTTLAPVTLSPTTLAPAQPPTLAPTTLAPNTLQPTLEPSSRAPTFLPTHSPSTLAPTLLPTLLPTLSPTPPTTLAPTLSPTAPTTLSPTSSPTYSCLDNALEAFMEGGDVWESSSSNDTLQYPTQLSCASPNANVSARAQYFTFVPPETNEYYLRVRYSGAEELVVEVRLQDCVGLNLGCGARLLDYSTNLVARSGLTSLQLTASERYVILVARKGGSWPISDYTVEVGLTSSPSGNGSANSAYLAALSSSLFLPILLPGCFFAPALLLALALCMRDRRFNPNQQGVAAYYGSCSYSLVTVRQLAITLWLLSVSVLVTTWAVPYAALAYLLSLITLVLGMRIHSAGNAPNFIQTDSARQANRFNRVLLVCSIVLALNAIPAAANVAQLLSPANMDVCDARFSGEEANRYLCTNLHLVLPIYGIIATASMVVSAVVAVALGSVLQRVVAKLNAAAVLDTKAIRDWQEKEQQRRYDERQRQSGRLSKRVSVGGGGAMA